MTVRGVPAAFEWINPTRIRLVTATAGGDAVVILRKTPVDEALVEFQAGSVLTEADLNKAIRQTLYVQQELSHSYSTSLEAARIRLGENLGVVTTPDELMDQLVQMSLASDVLTEFRQRIADIDLNAESILRSSLRTDALQAAVDTLSDLGDGAGVATVIEQERVERIEGDTALAQTLSLIGAVSGDSLGFILDTSTVRVSPTQSLAEKLDTIGSQFSTVEALITQEAQTRATADSGFATTLSLLGARTPDGSAFVMDSSKVQVGGGVSLGNRLAGIDTKIGNNSSAIVSEATARTSATNSLSQRIDGVVSTVGNHTASITQLFEARDGLYLKAGLALDNNGYITGWSLNNDGKSGSFVIRADRFSVVASDGRGNAVTPFDVTNNKITMKANVAIGGDLIVDGTLTNKSVQKNTLTGLTAAYTAAQLNISNSPYSPTTLQEAWIDVEGTQSPVVIDFTCFSHARYDSSGSFTLTYRVHRESSGTSAVTILELPVLMRTNSKVGNLTGMAPLKVIDRPGKGTWKYRVSVVASTSNMDEHYVSNRFLSATEHKTNS